MNASCDATLPTNANDPAVVIILSTVSILSLINTGIPCNGPRTFPDFLSASIAFAIAIASGFTSITELSLGPFLSMASMRCRYNAVSCSAVYLPAVIFSCSSVKVISFSSKSAKSAIAGTVVSFFASETLLLQDAVSNAAVPATANEPLDRKSLLFINI